MKLNNKIKTIFLIFFSIFILIIFNVWYNQATGIEITQLSPQGSRQMMGYIINTYTNKMIIIDGGTKEDTDNLKDYIKKHKNTVDYWFITHLHDDHIGAFLEIIKDENITVKNIIYSVNEKNWYQENEPDRAEISDEFYDAMINTKSNIINPYLHEELHIDNLKVKILGLNNPEIINNSGNNSSMVFKFTIHDKSILFLGDTGVESQEKLLKNNSLDDLKSYAVQMAHHGQAGVDEKLYQIINPSICFWPTPDWLWNNDIGLGEDSGNYKTKDTRLWIENLNVKENYVAKDGDLTIKIW